MCCRDSRGVGSQRISSQERTIDEWSIKWAIPKPDGQYRLRLYDVTGSCTKHYMGGRPSKDEKTKTRVDGPYTRDDEAKQSIFRPADAHAGNPIRRDRRGKQQEGSAQTRLSCVWVSANSTVVLKKQTKRIKNDGAVQITHVGGKLRRVIPEGRHLLQCIWKYNVLIIKDVGDFLYPT